MNNNLVQLLHEHPSIEKIYLNKEGEWQFAPLSGFEQVMTREELLGPIEEDVIEEEKQSKKSNPKNK